MYITNGRVFGGTPNILIFWLFLDNLSISEQTIDRALTLKAPDKLQLYGLYVYYVVHISDFGMIELTIHTEL